MARGILNVELAIWSNPPASTSNRQPMITGNTYNNGGEEEVALNLKMRSGSDASLPTACDSPSPTLNVLLLKLYPIRRVADASQSVPTACAAEKHLASRRDSNPCYRRERTSSNWNPQNRVKLGFVINVDHPLQPPLRSRRQGWKAWARPESETCCLSSTNFSISGHTS